MSIRRIPKVYIVLLCTIESQMEKSSFPVASHATVFQLSETSQPRLNWMSLNVKSIAKRFQQMCFFFSLRNEEIPSARLTRRTAFCASWTDVPQDKNSADAIWCNIFMIRALTVLARFNCRCNIVQLPSKTLDEIGCKMCKARVRNCIGIGALNKNPSFSNSLKRSSVVFSGVCRGETGDVLRLLWPVGVCVSVFKKKQVHPGSSRLPMLLSIDPFWSFCWCDTKPRDDSTSFDRNCWCVTLHSAPWSPWGYCSAMICASHGHVLVLDAFSRGRLRARGKVCQLN